MGCTEFGYEYFFALVTKSLIGESEQCLATASWQSGPWCQPTIDRARPVPVAGRPFLIVFFWWRQNMVFWMQNVSLSLVAPRMAAVTQGRVGASFHAACV
eukprot:361784-Chlamydomonas_euryale.AAC.1